MYLAQSADPPHHTTQTLQTQNFVFHSKSSAGNAISMFLFRLSVRSRLLGGRGALLILTFKFLFQWELVGLPNEVMAEKKPTAKTETIETVIKKLPVLAEMCCSTSVNNLICFETERTDNDAQIEDNYVTPHNT